MYVELVVEGTLGALAASAFPELIVERHQILITSSSDTLAILDFLTSRRTEVVALRQQAVQSEHD